MTTIIPILPAALFTAALNAVPPVLSTIHSHNVGILNNAIVITNPRHSITVVGVAKGANRNSLSEKDFLILDPWGGNLKSLEEASVGYIDLDSSWDLIIPVKSDMTKN